MHDPKGPTAPAARCATETTDEVCAVAIGGLSGGLSKRHALKTAWLPYLITAIVKPHGLRAGRPVGNIAAFAAPEPAPLP